MAKSTMEEIQEFLKEWALPTGIGLLYVKLGGPIYGIAVSAANYIANKAHASEAEAKRKHYHLVGKWTAPKPAGVSVPDVSLFFKTEEGAQQAYRDNFQGDTNRSWSLYEPTGDGE